MNQDSSFFVLDANIFIEAHRRYYAQDLCPGFWDSLTHYCLERRVLSIDRVRDELFVSQDRLVDWVKESPEDLFESTADESVINDFSEMMNWVQGNNQFLPEAKEQFAGAADGWVAAYAKVHDAVVVTHEVLNTQVRRRVPLPNVCRQFEVDYRDTFAMLRDLEVRFDWTPQGTPGLGQNPEAVGGQE